METNSSDDRDDTVGDDGGGHRDPDRTLIDTPAVASPTPSLRKVPLAAETMVDGIPPVPAPGENSPDGNDGSTPGQRDGIPQGGDGKPRRQHRRWWLVRAWNARPVLTGLVSAVVVAVAAALLATFVVSPLVSQHRAESQLSGLSAQSGTIGPVNTTVSDFTGTVISGTKDQRALTDGQTGKDAGVFVFSNGKSVSGRRTVDVYVDFSSQFSRNFFAVNAAYFQSMVDGGSIELKVHPVPSSYPLSVYAPEALAESFVTSPGSSWTYLSSLMKLPDASTATDATSALQMVAAAAKTSDVSGVSEQTVKNGAFSSWVYAVSTDSRLKVGFYPPIIYTNNKLIDTSSVNVDDPDALQTAILAR